MYVKQKSIGLGDLVFTLMILFGGIANAAETVSNAPLEKITIAYSSISGHMAPLWITQDRGFFVNMAWMYSSFLSRVEVLQPKA